MSIEEFWEIWDKIAENENIRIPCIISSSAISGYGNIIDADSTTKPESLIVEINNKKISIPYIGVMKNETTL